jgi:Tripartite tricarboxylate transporter family receptor
VLAVHPSLPARTPYELVAYAKANPGKVNYAFVPGTIGQMTAEMFARSAGIELTRIPYKGNGQAIGDLIGGHASMMVLSLSTILGSVKVGQLFALAVTTPERSKLLPDVPTIAESAVPGFSAAIRYGLVAPAGTPLRGRRNPLRVHGRDEQPRMVRPKLARRHDQSAIGTLRKVRNGTLDFPRIPQVDRAQLHADRSGSLDRGKLADTGGDGRVAQHRRALHVRYDLLEQLEPTHEERSRRVR